MSFLLFTAIQTICCLVQGRQKDVDSLKVIMQGLQLYGSAGLCSQDKSMFMWPKMIAPSWPKVVRPFADGSDVATHGLSIAVLSASTVPK